MATDVYPNKRKSTTHSVILNHDEKDGELVTFNNNNNDDDDDDKWQCPQCTSFNDLNTPICSICNSLPPDPNPNPNPPAPTVTNNNNETLNEHVNENGELEINIVDNDKFIFLETDVYEYNKCESIFEEFAIYCSYFTGILTIFFVCYSAVIGPEGELFGLMVGLAVMSLIITIILVYGYKKINKKMKTKNLSASMIVLNGNDNKFQIINACEKIIFGCFHLERLGQILLSLPLNDIQNVECNLNDNNQMIFVIYYYDSNTKQNELKQFNDEYFFCNKEWETKINYSLNKTKTEWK